ncbi:hypothetical protein KBC86_00805, partial [Candidatus Gracilibacteria bacterium]|nr:hypothetical protein [Candidatus Gracilibacteria bacterium]
KDATLKSQLEGYLKDPTNENVRKFQDAIGYKPDGDFRDFTLAALIKWAGMDAPTRAPDRETSNGMRVLVEGDPKIGEILHIGQLHQLSVTSPDATIMSCLSPEGEKKVIKGQRQIYEYLMKLKPDAIFAEGIYELTDDEDKALFQLFAAATFIAFGKIQVPPMKEVQNIFSVFKVKNKEELQDRILYMKGGGFVAGILSEKIKGAADVAKDLAAAKDIGLDLTTCMAAFKKMESLTDPTAIPESVKKVREKVALEKIKAYLEKNPGKKVVLVYGAEHNFSEEFSSVFPTGKQPKLQAIDMARHIDMKDEKGNPKGSILFELPVSYEWKTGAKAIYKGGLNQKGLPEGQGIAIHTDADGSKKYYVGEFSGDGSAYPVGEVTLMIVDKDGFTFGTAKGKMGKDGVFAEGVVMERSGKNSLIWKGGKWVDGPQETSNRGNDDLKKPGNPVGPVRDQLIKGGYTHDTASSSSKDGVTTDIYSKLGAKTFVIQHKEGKIISVKLDESTVSKKEITTADLEAWKDKLGDGIKWSNTGTEKDPKKIGEVEVKGFMNLTYSGSERSYTVIKDTLYVWEDESSTWMKSGLLEIRNGKIEKILPKIESIEERVKKMKKVTLTGLGDAYKDIVPEYDADKKAIFLKAPYIETPQGHIRNYFGISEELFLAGGMVETGTIAFVKGLYNVTITPIDGELIVKMEEVKPAPRTKLVDLTIAEQAAEATRLFQEYLDATEHNQVKLSTRIKRPDTALRWIDTKDNDFAVGIDIATGKSFAGTSRKWDKELTQFEQGLWDTIITFMNRAAKMKKQVPDTSDPYESIRKKLQDQLTAPAPAPTPAPAPASAPSVAAPASSAASVPARSPSPKPTAPAASGVRRDGDATNY